MSHNRIHNFTGNTDHDFSGLISGELIKYDGTGIVSAGNGSSVTSDTGTTIYFSAQTIFDLPSTPSTGNYTDDLTDSQLGIVQKMYHNNGTAPTFPAGWVLMGDGVYFTSELNIIYAEWVDGTRVEYWIIQEQ